MHDGGMEAEPTSTRGQAGALLDDGLAPRREWIIETVVSPFHCLYQDALHFHTQSHLRLARSESEASRLSRSALLLYLASAEALVHQAAVELGRPELMSLLADPSRPLPVAEAWRLLPAIVADGPARPFHPEAPPWPQFNELLLLRTSWTYPGAASRRLAYYRSERPDGDFEPIEARDGNSGATGQIPLDRLCFPRTGLPRDPYALRPKHLDTARGILDAAIAALDRRLGGELTREQRHRKEPLRYLPRDE
ncbi:MAG: hypothetical protein KGM43_16655 [Planctomycetota bacterium]|nr:hypothetical protein [Planctomycetota bacterium]